MGSCVSLHKDTKSTVKLRLSSSSNNDMLLINSPVKEKPKLVNDGDLMAKWSPPAPRFSNGEHEATWLFFEGSKDERFFDSQPWLESDCEEDYFSVHGGDFTPSRGSTPMHHSLQPSPSCESKKRLSELFQESLRSGDELGSSDNLRKVNSGGAAIKGVDKSSKSPTQCCIPKLISSRSLNGRRKGNID